MVKATYERALERFSWLCIPDAVLSRRLVTAISELADTYRSLAQHRDDLLQQIFKNGRSETIHIPTKQELEKKKANLISTSLVNHRKALGQLLS